MSSDSDVERLNPIFKRTVIGLLSYLLLTGCSFVLLKTPVNLPSLQPLGTTLDREQSTSLALSSTTAAPSAIAQATPIPIPTPTPSANSSLIVTESSAQPKKNTQAAFSISLIPSTITLSQQGESQQLKVLITDEQGNFLDNTQFELIWSSDKPAIISVDANGNVTALQSGFASISVQLKDNSSIKATADIKVGSSGSASAPSTGGSVEAIVEF